MSLMDLLDRRATYAARRYAPEIGSDLIQQFPERLPELFRALFSLKQIIEILEIQKLYPHAALKTLINAANYALQGYYGQDFVASDISFKGLMNPEEVADI